MKGLQAGEAVLQGAWVLTGDRPCMDAIGERITWLVAHELEKLAVDATGWDTLYRDPNDGRLWELTFPMSDGEGGGPPRLECIDLARARGKYGTRSA